MTTVPHDVRLLIFLTINAIVLWSSARFARHHAGTNDSIQVALDVMLIWYVVQYLAIGLPGVLGMLTAGSAALVALACSGAMLSIKRAARVHTDATARVPYVVHAAVAVVIALIAANVFLLRFAPPLADDVLTYHLPAAVEWIQTGKLGLHETWFFNPANTYSPLAGSTFAAWAMIFTNNDVLARFDQAPALVMLFLATLQLARTLGAETSTAAIIALAVACARPFIAQCALAKDDLFAAAFFVTAVVSLCSKDRLAPWRAGLAIGLFLATKYTTLLIAPILLLALDAPRRAGWSRKQFVVAIVVALLVAAPWYIRNVVLTGNPIFPAGSMFATARSRALIRASNLWRVLTQGHFATPAILMIPLIVVWLAAIASGRRHIMREPLARLCALGPPLAIGLFASLSPYAEVRFVNPAIALMIVCVAVLPNRIAMIVAFILSIASIGTSFHAARLSELALPAVTSFILIALVVAALRFAPRMPRVRRSIALVMLLVFIGVTYVQWPSYVGRCEDDANKYWSSPSVYGDLGTAWQFVRMTAPPGSTIAYANTYYTYPLTGYAFDHRVVYVPVRRNVRSIPDLGRIQESLSGEGIAGRVAELTNRNADREAWLANLHALGAGLLFVQKHPNGSPPPELRFAEADSHAFHRIFETSAAVVFEVHKQD